MKKIIGAVALASLVVGMASADVKFALNYRTQMVGFSRLIHAPNNEDGSANANENTNYWFQQTKGWQSASDTVSVTASGDFGGVTLRIDPSLDKDGAPTLQINQYNGYIKLGDFEIGGGNWKDGQYNGNYQVKNDSDAGWYQGDLFGLVKLGSLYAGATTLAVDDIVNFGGTDKGNSGYIKYQGELGDGMLTATVAAIGIGGKTWDEEDSVNTGFGVKLDYKLSSLDTQFVFKTASNKATLSGLGEQRAFGLHFLPTISGLTLMAGGSLGMNNGSVTELSLDVRARKVVGPASITFYTNISHITNKCDYISALKGGIGAEYLTGAGAIAWGRDAAGLFENNSAQAYNTHMWNMLSVRTKINNKLYVLFSTGDVMSLRNVGTDHWNGLDCFVAPGIQIMNGKSGIAAYARMGISNIGVKDYDKDGEGCELSVLVPVVIRVRF